jgi:hypothetical protein
VRRDGELVLGGLDVRREPTMRPALLDRRVRLDQFGQQLVVGDRIAQRVQRSRVTATYAAWRAAK